MLHLRSKQRHVPWIGRKSAAAAALAGLGAALRRRHLEDRLIRLGLLPRRRGLAFGALLGVGLVAAALGALFVPRGARPRRSLRNRLDDFLRRGRYALLKAEYRMEEATGEAAARAEQKARVTEQLVEKEVEGTIRGVKAALEEAKMTGR